MRNFYIKVLKIANVNKAIVMMSGCSTYRSIYRLILNRLRYLKYNKPKYDSKPPLTNIASERGDITGYSLICGPSTLLPYCLGKDAIEEVIAVLEKLEKDEYSEHLIEYYKDGLEKFGKNWVYADITTVLIGLSGIIMPENYLEVGVRRGRSLAMVLSKNPKCNAVCFDMWVPNYAGMDQPGPDYVAQEMKKFHHFGTLEFIDGDSHETMPQYFKQNPKVYFDLITIDGDHSDHGASIDLTHALPRLKVGGAVVFDDIAHPSHPALIDVWKKYVVSDHRFISYSFTNLGYGVGFAIRKY